MRATILQLRHSQYGAAIAKLSSGQFAAAVIPLVAAPVLGRIYTAEEYGVLGLYMAFVAILSSISTLQYQTGILAVRSERQAQAIAGLGILSSFAFAAIAALIAGAAWFLGGPGSGFEGDLAWLVLLPFSIVASALFLVGDAFLARRQKYGVLARLLVVSTAVSTASTIALGLAGWSVAGIMIGYFAGVVLRLLGYLHILGSIAFKPFALSFPGFVRLGRLYSGYPRFSLPAMLIASFIIQAPVLALGGLGAAVLVGAFTRAQRLVSMPFLLVGTAIGQVFRQRAAEDYRNSGSCRPIYRKTALMLAMIGAPPMGILLILAPRIFEIFLGPDWTIAGEIAQIMAPAIWLRMIASPLEAVWHFTGNQRIALWYNLAFLGAILAGSIGPLAISRDPMMIVIGFAVLSSAFYLLSLLLSWKCSKADCVKAAGPA